jgi:alkaline phosphatase D
LIDGKPAIYQHDMLPFSAKTAPLSGKKTRFRIAFGSCPRFQVDPVQQIWSAVSMWNPDLFLWLGDNMYADSLKPQLFAENYRRQRNIPLMQSLIHSVPQLAIWDDHDYGANDQDKNWPIKTQSLDISSSIGLTQPTGGSAANGSITRRFCSYWRSSRACTSLISAGGAGIRSAI